MQMFQIVALVACVALASGERITAQSTLTFDAEAARNRPVAKVTTLLKDMLKQLEKEQETDEEVYDKMACWCETNDKDKSKSIADAEARIDDLTTKIEELTAASARLNTEIAKLTEELARNKQALATATAIRQKEIASFQAEEKDLLGSISALKAAVAVLSKHQNGVSGSFLQVPRSHSLQVATTLQQVMQKHAADLEGVLTPSQRRAVSTFIQQPEDYFDAAPTFKQSYAPQSGQIFGILTQMQETFEKNLAAAQKEEQESQAAYESLKAAKEEEIAAGEAQIDAKSQELASTDEKNAQAKEDLVDTRKTMSADMEFLQMLKEKCAMTDSEWEERQKTRQLEMEACSKALAILSGDDAHDLFSKTFQFVQANVAIDSVRRNKASQLLTEVAHKFNRPRLATLAIRVRLDAFTKVKKAIDDMIEELLKEQADEVKQKDFCTDELNKNQLETEKKVRERKDLEAHIEDLEQTISDLTKAIDTLKAEISEMQVQLKRAGEDRELENKEFQQTIADQRASQKLLQAALGVLQGFYGKDEVGAGEEAFVQQEPAGPPPPAGFSAYKKNQASGGVMGMIQQIINDAKAMEAEALKAEEDAQSAYESFVKETNASIEAKVKDIANKSATRAKAEIDLAEAKQDHANVMKDLEQLSDYNAELHLSCDFVLKNFDVRQTARDEEVEALRQAKAILSGAKFEEFLQGGK